MNTQLIFHANRSSSLARVLRTAIVCLPLAFLVHSGFAADFVKPTPEELSMTSLKGYPGAPAVVLFQEEITRDDMHSVQTYRRLKILTEEGKKYANVELGYVSTGGGVWEAGDGKVVEDIVGRTIHPDGTIIPFTGKPYLKVLEKANGYKVQEKVFTLPDVEVGSIIEYRYATRINDHIFESPVWMIQDDLFVKEAHFVWYPTSHTLIDEEEQPINSISWFPILPVGVKIEHRDIPGTGIGAGPNQVYELHAKDVPPRVKEEYMPPIRSFSYRVNFSFTPYRSQQEYWAHRGKVWSKRVNKFTGPSNALKDATAKVITGANTPDEKLQKIYATVMGLENTQFTRERDRSEDKAAGVGQINDAADVLAHGRGTPEQLTELFIGMARAAGLDAYAMWVPNREEEIFTPMWMDTRQLDDYVAIVNLAGKERFFDPGSRYCAYGQLAWQHTAVSGLRQTEGGSAIGNTPFEPYKSNRLTRVANLTLTPQGEVSGKVDLTFSGAAAVRWRQVALRGDEEGLRKELREHAEAMLPKSLELEVADIKDLTSYDKPLAVTYKVKGTLGSSVGKRVMMPADVFLANASATFPHEKRETAVYFHYPQLVQDAVRINLPKEWAVEAVPANAKYSLPNLGIYNFEVTQDSTNITTRRQFAFGDVFVLPKEYEGLRSFYSQLETKDQETVILKPAAVTASNTASPSPAQ
jgi:hypothetical protein